MERAIDERVQYPPSDVAYQPQTEEELNRALPRPKTQIEYASLDNPYVAGDIVLDEQGRLLKRYLSYAGLAHTKLVDFDLSLRRIKRLIEETPIPVSETGRIELRDVVFIPPHYTNDSGERVRMTPRDARLRDETYEATIEAGVVLVKERQGIVHEEWLVNEDYRMEIGKVPVMLGSELCILHGKTPLELFEMGESADDPFGYFIAGNEYALMMLDQLRMNRPICTMRSKAKGKDKPKELIFSCQMTNDDLRGTKKVEIVYDATREHRVSWTFDAQNRDVQVSVNVLTFLRWIGGKSADSYIERLFDFFDPRDHMRAAQLLHDTVAADRQQGAPEKEIIELIAKAKAENLGGTADPVEAIAAEMRGKAPRDALLAVVASLRVDETLVQLDRDAIVRRLAELRNLSLDDDQPFSAAAAAAHAPYVSAYFQEQGLAYGAVTKAELRGDEYRAEATANLIPQTPERERKIDGLLLMLYRLVRVQMDPSSADDKDDWKVKRVKMPGETIFRRVSKLFTDAVAAFRNKIQTQHIVVETPVVFRSNFEPTRSLRTAFSSNDWKLKRAGAEVPAYSQLLQRRTPLDTISHLNRIMGKTGAKSHNSAMRQVQPSQIGIVDPAETQDGESCGKNRPLGITANIVVPSADDLVLDALLASIPLFSQPSPEHTARCRLNSAFVGWCDPNEVQSVLDKSEIEFTANASPTEVSIEADGFLEQGILDTTLYDRKSASATTPIVLNGRFLGWCAGQAALTRLQGLKLRGTIPRDACIVLDERVLYVYTDASRAVVPMLRVNEATGRLIIDEKGLFDADLATILEEGALEYLDAWEIDTRVQFASTTQQLWTARQELAAQRALVARLETWAEQGAESYVVEDRDANLLRLSPAEFAVWAEEERADIARVRARANREIASLESAMTAAQQRAEDADLALPSRQARLEELQQLLDRYKRRLAEIGGPSVALSPSTLSDEPTEAEVMALALAQQRGASERMEAAQLQRKIAQVEGNWDAYVAAAEATLAQERQAIKLQLEAEKRLFNDRLARVRATLEEQDKRMVALESRTAIAGGELGAELLRQKAVLRRLEGARRYTHCLLDPNAIWAVTTAQLPHTDHNQAPRNTFGGTQLKQAQSTGHNSTDRFDTSTKRQVSAQQPMTATQQYTMFGMDKSPASMNAIVAVMTDNWTQEDGVAVSQTFVDAGGGLVAITHSHSARLREPKSGENIIEERFGLPPEKCRRFRNAPAVYALIDPNTGAPRPHIKFMRGSQVCLIARYRLVSSTQHKKVEYVDTSEYAKFDEEGYVVAVYLGHGVIKVKTEEMRPLGIGDKLSTRSAQKQVVTRLMREADRWWAPMPTGSTIKPDIVINPLAIPTRMTMSLILEQLQTPMAVAHAMMLDATAFKKQSQIATAAALVSALPRLGYSVTGKYRLYRGDTGEIAEALVFVGPVAYNRLIPMVLDKYQVRGNFRAMALNRQPVRGRTHIGGVRFGEMERDGMIAHGAARALWQRTAACSDLVEAVYCTSCAAPAELDPYEGTYVCPRCRKEGVTPSLRTISTREAMNNRARELAMVGVRTSYILGEEDISEAARRAGTVPAVPRAPGEKRVRPTTVREETRAPVAVPSAGGAAAPTVRSRRKPREYTSVGR